MNEIKLLDKKEISAFKINQLEKKFNIELPNDYKDWLLKNGVGYPKPDVFTIGEKSEVLNNLLDFDKAEYGNVYEVLEDIEDRLPSTLFPFGEDPFDNLLCFDYSDNQSVVYWNHEMLDNNGHNTVFVAQSFTDFINSLYFDNE